MATQRWQFVQALSISVGMAFATSCFAMAAGMAGATGMLVLPAIGASALIALAVAHAIGRLAKRFPSALGIRTYIKAAFGNRASLFFVFLYLLMIVLIAGVESTMYATVVQHVSPGLDARLIILGVFALVIGMNIFGYEFSSNVQVWMVLLMLAGVLGLSLWGISAGAPQLATLGSASAPQFAAVPATIISAFFLFVGFEWVTSAQPGSRSAARQLPWVLLASIVLLGLVYTLFSMATLANFSAAEWGATDKPQMLLAEKLWGTAGVWAMLVVSTCAVLTTFNAGMLGAARLLYALAREGVLPRWLASTAPATGAPVRAIGVTAAVSLGSALAAYLLQSTYLLGTVAAAIICVCYCGLLAASLALHRADSQRHQHQPNSKPQPQRAPGAAIAQTLEGLALLLMLGLFAALLFGAGDWRQGVIVAAACALMLALAVAADWRAARPSSPAPATPHASGPTPSTLRAPAPAEFIRNQQ